METLAAHNLTKELNYLITLELLKYAIPGEPKLNPEKYIKYPKKNLQISTTGMDVMQCYMLTLKKRTRQNSFQN